MIRTFRRRPVTAALLCVGALVTTLLGVPAATAALPSDGPPASGSSPAAAPASAPASTPVSTPASAPAEADAPAATGTLLRDGTGLYPRAVRLAHSGEANGRVLASVVTFDGNNGLGAIYESTDDGETFQEVGTVADPESAAGQGLCCATLFEVPQQVGELAPGTLLWASSAGQEETDRRMALRVWRSDDVGRTWSYLSSCATASGTGGLWEPEFSIAEDGALVCHYADETDPAHSQKLMSARSYDGVNWVDHRPTVAGSWEPDRPGMPVVRTLPNGTYFMSYEICNPGGQYQCVVHYRTSPDGWDWGDPTHLGYRPQTADGRYFRAAPTVAWSPAPDGDPDGRILLIGQTLLNADGTRAEGNGRTVLVNSAGGEGPWSEIAAPVAVNDPYNNFCPNYSSPLLPSTDGRQVLQIATDWDGEVCKPYYATGPVD